MATVRRNLAALGLGLVVQRAAQLVALLAVARSLGEATTGVYAQGVALGSLLAVLATAGLRNPVARALAREPDNSGAWLRAAIRARLRRTAALVAAAAAVAWLCSGEPWFWALCALHAVPAAFDLKHLGDAVARTRTEVLLETAASLSFAAAVLGWLAAGGSGAMAVVALHLACRALYAMGAAWTVARLPVVRPGPDPRELRRLARGIAPAQIAGDLCVTADVWIVGRLAGDGAAGIYAVAARIAGAAAMPSAQLARLFFAHQLHAVHRGDVARTTRVALRAIALVLLPVLGGGWVVAGGLCGLLGGGFGAAGDALRGLLLAVACQHVGWQAHQALLALGRDRDYVAALWRQSLLHTALLLAATAWAGATGAAAAAAAAQLAFAATTLRALGRQFALPWSWLRGPLMLGLLTAAAAAVAGLLPTGRPLAAQLAAGAAAALGGLWAVELRHRWRRLGHGLAQASGLR